MLGIQKQNMKFTIALGYYENVYQGHLILHGMVSGKEFIGKESQAGPKQLMCGETAFLPMRH